MNRIVICIWLILCIVTSRAYSQELFVKEVMLQPSDMTAITDPCLDNNGDTCALVKIITDDLIGLEFDNTEQYVKARTIGKGSYEVYMPYLLNKLSYKHKEYLSGQINLADFGFKRLKSGKTYIVSLETPSAKGKVVLKVQPSSASVLFNGQELPTVQSGIYEFSESSGIHQYSVEASNFIPFQGLVQIDKSEVKVISLSLKPILHSVYVESDVNGAIVFIDGVNYGEVGRQIEIAQGMRKIRIFKDKYIDIEETVEVDSTTTNLFYSLEKNKNVLEIHAVPVTIFTESKKLYKNNKEIKDWGGNGSVVKFMPGKYMISNSKGKEVIIEVSDTPLTINL